MASSKSPISSSPIPQTNTAIYLPTTEAYDRWAAIYDTDSNPLQALDDLQLQTLLPNFIDLVLAEHRASRTPDSPLQIIDLGCGTGRNTAKLLPLLPPNTSLTGLDSSEQMLSIARSRCAALLRTPSPTISPPAPSTTSPSPSQTNPPIHLSFSLFDIFNPQTPHPSPLAHASALLSTLVLEHIPLRTFFAVASAYLRPGGLLLLTNMHPDMGAVSQAGFKDPRTGEKVRPESYAHGLRETVEEARRWGLGVVEMSAEVLGGGGREGRVVGGVRGVLEAEITEELVAGGGLGMRAEKWVGVRCWFGVVLRKERGEAV